MRKTIFIFAFALLTTVTYGQDGANEAVTNNASVALTRAVNVNQSSYGSSTVFVNPPRRIEGSIYMFEDWFNQAILQTKDKKRMALNNVNYNIRRNRIAAKFSRDSLFVLDLASLDKVIINGQSFKKLDPDLDGRIFEVIFETEKADLLSFHFLKIVEGSANPMVNRKVDKFKHSKELLLYMDGDLIPLRLKKKEILKVLAKNESEENAIIGYYKENRLSYKNAADLKKVLMSGIIK